MKDLKGAKNSLGDMMPSFFLFFLSKFPSFRLLSPPRDVTQELCKLYIYRC